MENGDALIHYRKMNYPLAFKLSSFTEEQAVEGRGDVHS